MGKYKISVASTALHLVDAPENPLADIAKAAVLSGTDILSAVFTAATAGNLNTKMSTLFDYAETTYTLALPSGINTQISEPSKPDIAAAIIDDIAYPYNVVVLNDAYKPYRPIYDILDYMVSARGLDVISGTINKWAGLSFSNAQKMFIVDSFISDDDLNIIIEYEYHEFVNTPAYDEFGYPYTAVLFTKTGDYTETIARPQPATATYDGECLVATYLKLDINGAELPGTFAWVYQLNNNTYPQLNMSTRTVDASRYFPVVPIRSNNVDLTGQQGANAAAIKETPLYKTSKELLQIIGTPIDYLGDQINKNPDIASIDNAYVMFGANLQSNRKETLAYLNNYFDYIGSLGVQQYSTYDPSIDPTTVSTTFTEHGLVLHMNFGSVATSYIPGVIDDGLVGNARKTIDITEHYATYAYVPSQGEGSGDTIEVTPFFRTGVLTLDLQISSTTIRRVIVTDLVVTNYINGNNVVITSLYEISIDPDNNNCIIPLEYNIALTVPEVSRANLYADCMLLVITCYQRTKLKWYQQSWFAPVVMIVMVVIMVVSIILWSPEIGLWIDGMIAAATIGVGALLIYLAMTLVPMILYSLAIGYAAKLIMEVVGVKIGVIIAVVLAAVAMMTGQWDAAAELFTQYLMMTPQLALMLSAALIDAADAMVQMGMQTLSDNYIAFTDLLSKANEALASNIELQSLDLSDEIDPYAVLKRGKQFLTLGGETPAAFFHRTLNLVDITYSSVHSVIPNFTTDLLAININKPVGA